MSKAEAAALGMEELLCVLCHQRLNSELAALDAEAGRIASLPFGDPAQQRRLLSAVDHRQRALLDRFYSEGRNARK